MKDWELLRRYVDERSQPAFQELATRYAGLVYGTCLRELRSAELAEDASQAVFILLARKARTFRRQQMLSSWLFQASVMTSRNLRRAEGRRARREETLSSPAAPMSANVEQEIALSDGLASLPAPDRDAVIGRFIDGLSFAEVASTLGIREDAARMRVKRGLERLRRHFERQGIALAVGALPTVISELGHQSMPSPESIAGAVLDAPHAWNVVKFSSKAVLFGAWITTLAALLLVVNYLSNLSMKTPLPPPPAKPSMNDGVWRQAIAHAVPWPKGDVKAPYTVIEFGDFACPQCGAMHSGIENLASSAPVSLYFVNRPFPRLKGHEYAVQAAEAGYAAAAQGKFWPMFDALYSHQKDLDPSNYAAYANQAGLNGATLQKDVQSGKYLARVTDSYQFCDSAGFQLTPTIVVRSNKTGAYQIAAGKQEIDRLIESEPWQKVAAATTSAKSAVWSE